MTSRPLNSADAFEITLQGDRVALPVPTHSLPTSSTSVVIKIRNRTSTVQRFYGAGLLPELLDQSMQPIRCKLTSSRDVFGYNIEPANFLSCEVKKLHLTWQDGKLNLEVWDSSDRQKRATFKNLQPGEYLLRFKYCVPSNSDWRSTPLKTEYLVLSLVEPLKTNLGIIEVEGLQFETIAPQRTVVSPHPESVTPVEFLLQIRNTSSEPHLFLLFGLMPELQNAAGGAVERGCARNAYRNPIESDFRLLQPGKSLEYAIEGKFSWYENELRLSGYETSGGYWSFDMAAAQYWVRLTYTTLNLNMSLDPIYFEDDSWQLLRDLWQGCVVTPAQKFAIVYAKT